MPEDRSRVGESARFATFLALVVAVVSAITLIALAIREADTTLAVKLVQWAFEAAFVALGLAIVGAVTWGDS